MTSTRSRRLGFYGYTLILLVVFALGQPLARAGLTLQSGDIVVAAHDNGTERISLLNRAGSNGSLSTITSGGELKNVSQIQVGTDGLVYAADATAGLVRITPSTGAQTIVVPGGARALALNGNTALVTTNSGGLERVNLGTGMSTPLAVESGHTLSYLALDAERNVLFAVDEQQNPSPETAFIQGIARLNPQTGQRSSYLLPPDVDFVSDLSVTSGGEVLAVTQPLETGSAGSFVQGINPETGATLATFNAVPNPLTFGPYFIAGIGLSPADKFFAAVDTIGDDPHALLIQFQFNGSFGSYQPLFSQISANQFSMADVAVAPGGGPQAIPLPAAAGPGLITLGLIGMFVTWRPASSRRPC
jgi:hypothetical protein